ncbi:hypothetical protein EIN_369320 [Entamoeba invadens IP1]|uniref:Uncharacterized protein n=1 Tax=Entamoeba invadens IP1 TaxID=370355 RepID=A0A0A1UBM1_ENTIV|nr:hypothetical protein EIN_369320 [Entamoeba invadens IP1]ELP92610.1 hypothetical protein EIN_369320 [Entamoeba invadens IP1]|eukprot:XP_004259381.1 hypothetical protein EIN_369320 [Entamoeba invadens IP1]
MLFVFTLLVLSIGFDELVDDYDFDDDFEQPGASGEWKFKGKKQREREEQEKKEREEKEKREKERKEQELLAINSQPQTPELQILLDEYEKYLIRYLENMAKFDSVMASNDKVFKPKTVEAANAVKSIVTKHKDEIIATKVANNVGSLKELGRKMVLIFEGNEFENCFGELLRNQRLRDKITRRLEKKLSDDIFMWFGFFSSFLVKTAKFLKDICKHEQFACNENFRLLEKQFEKM